MAKSFYIERIRARRLWSPRSIPGLAVLLVAIGWKPFWRLLGGLSDLVFLGSAIRWIVSEGKMSAFLQSYGWLVLVGIFLWLIFRASRRLPKQQYDIGGWDAFQFILNDTAFGEGKDKNLIERYLKLAIEKGMIRLWGQPPHAKRYDQISRTKMSSLRLDLEPGGSGGQVCDERAGMLRGDYWFSPKFSIEELNRVFRSKGLLVRIAEWLLRREQDKAKKIEGELRD